MEIELILKNAGKSITKERINIFNFIKTKHIFSANDILKNFGDLGRASIFRTINLFLEIGAIRKINLGEKAESYEINEKSHHHEHMKCEKCGDIISFESNEICKKIIEEATNRGFLVKEHNIGIIGICKKHL